MAEVPTSRQVIELKARGGAAMRVANAFIFILGILFLLFFLIFFILNKQGIRSQAILDRRGIELLLNVDLRWIIRRFFIASDP